jgi:hypothetical protein
LGQTAARKTWGCAGSHGGVFQKTDLTLAHCGRKNTRTKPGIRTRGQTLGCIQANSTNAFFIFFMAATSIWQMRSALTPSASV